MRARPSISEHSGFPRLAGLLGLLVLASGLGGCSGLFFQPSRDNYFDPGTMGFRYRDIDIPVPSGHHIRLRYLPHLGDSSRGLVVHFHGNAENLTSHFRSVAWMGLAGWDLLLVDYSGYGASEGEPSPSQAVEDARTALDWAADSLLPGLSGKLVLYGQSLGGAILLRSFPEWKGRDRTDLVLTEGTFDSYQGIALDFTLRQWFTWPAAPCVWLLVSDAQSPRGAIPAVAPTPLLTLSCLEDKVVPTSFQRKVDGLAKSPHWLWTQEGCGHIRFFRSQKWRTRFEEFVDSLPSRP